MSQDESLHDQARPENANAMPGGSVHTAGGKVKDAGILDAVKTIKVGDFKDVHKKPCVRDALLAGIGLGFGAGGIRAIMGVSVWNACCWAAGAFCISSTTMHEFCQRKRKLEREGMQRVVEVIDGKKAERQKKAEDARAARRQAKEES